jgi:ADP-L-glycero-D-manno-heptose 6-epimerase
MIIVTGAAGFIGSCLVSKLNEAGISDLLLVDDFSNADKMKNLSGKQYAETMHRNVFINWFQNNAAKVESIFHIGAKTDTTLFDVEIFNELNLNYTKSIWNICAENKIPMVYASSAATYGAGENGYDDNEATIPNLIPLNPYGQSKQDFDVWALQQKNTPPNWYGLKFFNVYGPNEFHKARMASVVFHSYNQIKKDGFVKLFKSHRPDYKDGEQLRDFVYVKDVTDVIMFLKNEKPTNGIYNLGSGKARTFKDLVNAIFSAVGKLSTIEFIDTPIDIRDKYQYFTEANMTKLQKVGYPKPFTTIEQGVKDYVLHYLNEGKYW